MRKRYSHEIIVNRSIEHAFPLFTPKGEEDWVPGWKPEYYSPVSGETCREMLFATGEGAERTWWTCLAYEPENYHVRYMRLTPESRSAFVDVACRTCEEGGTAVTVSYDIQALGPSGETYIEDMTEDAFAGMIGEWPKLIARMDQTPA